MGTDYDNEVFDYTNEELINYKCEWKFECCGFLFGDPTGLYYTSCGKNYSDFSTPGKFCKNCGKPIKITQ